MKARPRRLTGPPTGPFRPADCCAACAIAVERVAARTVKRPEPASVQGLLQRTGAMHRRVAGTDVHRMLHVVTVLIEQPDGSAVSRRSREFGSLKRDCLALAAWLAEQQVQLVVMESTGIYWKSVYAHLEKTPASRSGSSTPTSSCMLPSARPTCSTPSGWPGWPASAPPRSAPAAICAASSAWPARTPGRSVARRWPTKACGRSIAAWPRAGSCKFGGLKEAVAQGLSQEITLRTDAGWQPVAPGSPSQALMGRACGP